MKNPFVSSDGVRKEFGEIIDAKDVVKHPSTSVHHSNDSEMIDKLTRVAPFLSMMRNQGMTYKQISEVLEALTSLTVTPSRLKRYIRKISPPTIKITITDRNSDNGS